MDNIPSNKDKPKRPMGAPSKLTPAKLDMILKMAGEGHTNEQIAKIIGVNVRTLQSWTKENEDLYLAIKQLKSQADAKVEQALFSRATGTLKVKERKVVTKSDGSVEETLVEKDSLPDATSMIFWLKNRQPGKWRERTEVEHVGGDNGPKVIIQIPSNGREANPINVLSNQPVSVQLGGANEDTKPELPVILPSNNKTNK